MPKIIMTESDELQRAIAEELKKETTEENMQDLERVMAENSKINSAEENSENKKDNEEDNNVG